VKPRLLVCVSLLLAVAAPSLSAQKADPAASPFEDVIEVNVVNVDVYVTDKAGKPVPGLDRRDFELYEDGKRVEITNFEAVDRAQVEASGAPGSTPQPAGPAGEAAAGAPADGLHLVVYVDNFNLRQANRARAVQQLRQFLTQRLAPGDKVMMATYDLGLNVRLPFTSDPESINAALDGLSRLTVQGDEGDRARRQTFQQMMTIQEVSLKDMPPLPCPQHIVTPAHSYAASKRQEVIRTLHAMTLLVNSLSGVPGRKAVLHVSDGISLTPGEELFEFLFQICGGGAAASGIGSTGIVDRPSQRQSPAREEQEEYDPDTIFDSRMLGPQSYQAASQAALDAQAYNVAKEISALASHANAHRVTLYTLEASGAQAPVSADASYGPGERLLQIPAIARVEKLNRQDTLNALASATGGRAFLDSINFLPDLALMRQDFDLYYSLGYAPARLNDGREHRLEVKMKRPGLRVRNRQSYRDKTVLERTVDRTLAALLYGIEDNPLDITIEIGEQTAKSGSRYMVPVSLRIPIFKLGILNNQETFQGKVRLFVATRGEKGMTPIRQVEVPIQIPREQVLTAMGKYYVYTLSLEMGSGEQHIAVAVRDETTATTSFLAKSVQVGAGSSVLTAVGAASQN
jgi:VWFA-related protein